MDRIFRSFSLRGTLFIALSVGALGFGALMSHGAEEKYLWLSMGVMGLLIPLFDTSRGSWLTYLFSFALFLLLGLAQLRASVDVVNWFLSFGIGLTALLIGTQVGPGEKPLYVCVALAILIGALPLFFSNDVLFNDHRAIVFVPLALLFAGTPLAIQHLELYRPAVIWRLLAVMQTALRFGFLIWIYSWKPVLLDTQVRSFVFPTVVGSIVALFIFSGIFNRGNWQCAMMTLVSVLVIALGLLRLEELKPLLWLLSMSHGLVALTPGFRLSRRGKGWDLSSFEMGGIGSSIFILMNVLIVRAASVLTREELALLLFMVSFAGCRLWTQVPLNHSWGSLTKERGLYAVIVRGVAHLALYGYCFWGLFNV